MPARHFSLEDNVFLIEGMEPIKNEGTFVYVTTRQGLYAVDTALELRLDKHPVRTKEPTLIGNGYSWSPSTLALFAVSNSWTKQGV